MRPRPVCSWKHRTASLSVSFTCGIPHRTQQRTKSQLPCCAAFGLAPPRSPRVHRTRHSSRRGRRARTTVSSLSGELVRRSLCHVGVVGYHAHVTASTAVYHALSTLPPAVWFAGMLTLAGTVYEISKGAYQLLLFWGAQSQWGDVAEQEPLVLYGIDLSRSAFFNRESVKRAVEFAAQAHHCQKRRTGEPYVVHCIETALIVESNLGQLEDDSRAEAAVVAALLHDVLDDTSAELSEIQAEFGDQVADMVKKVSQLNNANQLLRRRKRQGLLRRSPEEQAALWGELKNMILAMVVAEPLVVLIKLADRLHNMRTVYVLKPDKQRSVSEETQEVWCSMAERLGWDALKSEMEDLCFAALQPDAYTELRSKLHKLWGLEEDDETLTEAAPQPPSFALPVLPPVILAQTAAAIPKAALAAVNALQTAVALDKGSASLSATNGPVATLFSLGKSVRPRSIPAWNPKLFVGGNRAGDAGGPTRVALSAEGSRAAQSGGWAAYTVCSMDDHYEDVDERGEGCDDGSKVDSQVFAEKLEQETRVWRAAAEAMQERRLSHAMASTSQLNTIPLNTTKTVKHTVELPLLAPKPELPSSRPPISEPCARSGTPASITPIAANIVAAKSLNLSPPSARNSTQQSPPSTIISTASTRTSISSSAPSANIPPAAATSYPATYSKATPTTPPAAYHMAEPGAAPAVLLSAVAAHAHRSPSASDSLTSPPVQTLAAEAEECTSSGVAVLTQAPAYQIGTDEVLTPSQLQALEEAYSSPSTVSYDTSYCTSDEEFAGPVRRYSSTGQVTHTAVRTDESATGMPHSNAAVVSTKELLTRSTPYTASSPTQRMVSSSADVAEKKLTSSAERPATTPSNYLYITSSHEVVLQELPLSSGAASGLPAVADSEGEVEEGSERLSLPPPLPTPPPPPLTPQQRRLKSLLATVVAFDSSRFGHQAQVPNVGGMRALDAAANELLYRIRAGSYSAGLAITVQGRLKSMRSVGHKMRQKDLTVEQVYDARGLRVIVDDEQGAREHEAMYVCYRVEQTVRGMYKLIPGQYDDYIANPKPSGYRALHMAVRGPDRQPMEVQVKTSSMHQHAEFGGAAHWAYKEQVPLPKLVTHPAQASKGPYDGQPLIQVDFSGYNGRFRYGVVVGVDSSAASTQLLVAIRCGGTVPEYPFWAPISFYRELHSYATKHFLSKGLRNPGNGDLKVVLEQYVACNDGRYHRIDQFGQVQRYCTVSLKRITALDLGERQSGLGFVPPNWRQLLQKEAEDADPDRARLFRQRQRAFVKTQIARRRLQGKGADSPPPPEEDEQEQLELLKSEEVAVLIWPDGKITHFPRGTTAGAVVKQRGILQIENTSSSSSTTNSDLVNVNNQLVPESTPLEDGDLLILSREKLQI